jgi:hypothetical protein
VENNVQEGTVDMEPAIVLNEAQSLEFIHEEINLGARCPDHFRQGLSECGPESRRTAESPVTLSDSTRPVTENRSHRQYWTALTQNQARSVLLLAH